MSKLPSQTYFAKQIAEKHGFTFELIDKGEGCLFKISKGDRSMILGSASLCSYPMNNAFSASLVNDKVFTNYVLDSVGVKNLGGKCFFLSPEGRSLRGDGCEVEDAYRHFSNLNKFAFIKPLKGSLGHYAEIVRGDLEFENYISRCSNSHDAIVIQDYFVGTEYRVFILEDEPLFCIKKLDVSIKGDGKSNIGELVDKLNSEIIIKAISPYPKNVEVKNLFGEVLNSDIILEKDEIAIIPGRRNISLGISPELIDPIPTDLSDIALKAHKACGLKVSAVDFICKENDIRVIELNANPWINSLEILNRQDLVEKIWLYIINYQLSS